jgi:hypothetical protein
LKSLAERAKNAEKAERSLYASGGPECRIKEKGERKKVKGKSRICRRGDPWSRNDNIREHSVRAGKAKSPSLPLYERGKKKGKRH